MNLRLIGETSGIPANIKMAKPFNNIHPVNPKTTIIICNLNAKETLEITHKTSALQQSNQIHFKSNPSAKHFHIRLSLYKEFATKI